MIKDTSCVNYHQEISKKLNKSEHLTWCQKYLIWTFACNCKGVSCSLFASSHTWHYCHCWCNFKLNPMSLPDMYSKYSMLPKSLCWLTRLQCSVKHLAALEQATSPYWRITKNKYMKQMSHLPSSSSIGLERWQHGTRGREMRIKPVFLTYLAE